MDDLEHLLENPAIVVRVASAKGSTPREEDALMVVTADQMTGTVGGGQLEYMAIDEARRMLKDGRDEEILRLPLGPEIGQCCGGNVTLKATRVTEPAPLLEEIKRLQSALPHVYVFGAGHVGKALARALSALPVHTHSVETRAQELSGVVNDVEKHLLAMPETIIQDAPPGSAFVTMTHDHASDFLIISEALKRQDAAYIGMIGSRTKRKQLERWYLGEGGSAQDLARLTSPIGGPSNDKRPAVIAALVAAEIIQVFAPQAVEASL